MAHGLPIIVYRADGTELDLVAHGETGLLLEEGTPDAIRSAIEQLADDPAQAAAWGRRGRQRLLEQFSTRHTALATMRAVEAALTSRRSGQSSFEPLQ